MPCLSFSAMLLLLEAPTAGNSCLGTLLLLVAADLACPHVGAEGPTQPRSVLEMVSLRSVVVHDCHRPKRFLYVRPGHLGYASLSSALLGLLRGEASLEDYVLDLPVGQLSRLVGVLPQDPALPLASQIPSSQPSQLPSLLVQAFFQSFHPVSLFFKPSR